MSNCTKEFQNSDCYQNELKYEKNKLHVRYLLIIAGIILCLGIVIAVGNDTGFSAQISMASTISSIILSVVAIFMSIVSENRNSSAQNYMLEASTKLSLSVSQIEDIASALNEKMKNVEKYTSNLSEKMDSISFGGENGHSSKQKEKFSDEEIIKIYKKIIPNSSRRELLSEIIEYPLVVLINNASLRTVMASEVFSYMKEVQQCTEKDATLDLCWGMALVFSKLGMNSSNVEGMKKLLLEVQSNLDEDNSEAILEFHYKYKSNT